MTMSMKFFKRRQASAFAICLLAMAMLCPRVCYGDGLRTGFGKVVLENVPMGTAYSMRRDSKFPLVIKNESDREIQLKLEVLIPEKGEIQEGYEAILDTKWIVLEKDMFIVEPNGKAETDVTIVVPNDKKYVGRKFHVFIWSHTIGESLGLGIKSKLLFSVGEAGK